MDSEALRFHPIDYLRRLHPWRRIGASLRGARLRRAARRASLVPVR